MTESGDSRGAASVDDDDVEFDDGKAVGGSLGCSAGLLLAAVVLAIMGLLGVDDPAAAHPDTWRVPVYGPMLAIAAVGAALVIAVAAMSIGRLRPLIVLVLLAGAFVTTVVAFSLDAFATQRYPDGTQSSSTPRITVAVWVFVVGCCAGAALVIVLRPVRAHLPSLVATALLPPLIAAGLTVLIDVRPTSTPRAAFDVSVGNLDGVRKQVDWESRTDGFAMLNSDASVRWRLRPTAAVQIAVAAYESPTVIVIARLDDASTTYAIDADSGALEWTAPTRPDVDPFAVRPDGFYRHHWLAITALGRRVTAMSTSTGATTWVHDVGPDCVVKYLTDTPQYVTVETTCYRDGHFIQFATKLDAASGRQVR